MCWVGGGEAGLERHAADNMYLCITFTSPGAKHAEVADAFVSFAILIFFSSGCFPKKRTLKWLDYGERKKEEIITVHFIFIEEFNEINNNNIQ